MCRPEKVPHEQPGDERKRDAEQHEQRPGEHNRRGQDDLANPANLGAGRQDGRAARSRSRSRPRRSRHVAGTAEARAARRPGRKVDGLGEDRRTRRGAAERPEFRRRPESATGEANVSDANAGASSSGGGQGAGSRTTGWRGCRVRLSKNSASTRRSSGFRSIKSGGSAAASSSMAMPTRGAGCLEPTGRPSPRRRDSDGAVTRVRSWAALPRGASARSGGSEPGLDVGAFVQAKLGHGYRAARHCTWGR